MKKNTLRYVALGDSYTICEGAEQEESWPVLLTKHLVEKGLPVELVANPARTGYTTTDLIDLELEIFENSAPGFATLLIGVNDWVRGVEAPEFREKLISIVERIQAKLPDKKFLVLITIPDFGLTPNGSRYGGGRDISKGISEFNSIILEEAAKRGLKTIDIFPVSQKVKTDPGLVAKDGLHPSAKQYADWENIIFPAVYELLTDKK